MRESVILWKLGYSEQYSRLSPGSLLLESLARELCYSKTVKEINLTTDQAWYDNWEMLRRKYYDSLIVFKRPSAVVLLYFPEKMKSLIKKIPGIHKIKAALTRLSLPQVK
jgi:hypothetical protein